LWVVVFHFLHRPLVEAGAPWPLLAFTGFGDIAVPFFFVLSGYVLAYTYAASDLHGHIREFYVARMARTYPVYLLALILCIGIAAVDVDKRSLPDPLGLVMTVLGIQSWAPAHSTAWNFPAWSLSVEFFLYAIFPPMLALLGRPRVFWPGYVAVTATILFFAIAHTVRGAVDYEWTHLPLLHLTSFATGMGFAHAHPIATLLTSSRAAALMLAATAGLMAVTLARYALGLQGWWPLFETVLLVPLFAGLIVGAAHLGTSWLDRSLLKLLGEASYALYILQLPVALVAVAVLRAFAPAPILWPLVAIMMLIGVSVSSHRYFERPTRQWIRNVAAARAPQ
jgi:peptidoglycan/LPS O-acetylase OafA/YrhL